MEGLGIDPVLLFTQAVNFLIMAAVLAYFVYKPILKTLEERKKNIKEGLRLQEEMKAEKEKMDEARKRIIVEANEEAREIIKQAIQEAKKKTDAVFSQERKKIEQEREKMQEGIAKEKEKIIREARKASFNYAFLISKKIIGEKLSKKEQEEILNEAIEELEKS